VHTQTSDGVLTQKKLVINEYELIFQEPLDATVFQIADIISREFHAHFIVIDLTIFLSHAVHDFLLFFASTFSLPHSLLLKNYSHMAPNG
jgi:hypothetical protein